MKMADTEKSQRYIGKYSIPVQYNQCDLSPNSSLEVDATQPPLFCDNKEQVQNEILWNMLKNECL
jgi:hypothetical protein